MFSYLNRHLFNQQILKQVFPRKEGEMPTCMKFEKLGQSIPSFSAPECLFYPQTAVFVYSDLPACFSNLLFSFPPPSFHYSKHSPWLRNWRLHFTIRWSLLLRMRVWIIVWTHGRTNLFISWPGREREGKGLGFPLSPWRTPIQWPKWTRPIKPLPS